MLPAHSLLGAALGAVFSLSDPLPPRQPQLGIAIAGGTIEFTVVGPQEPFVGIVIASLRSDLVHFLVGLPPLLADAVVLDFGASTPRGHYVTSFAEHLLPPGIEIHVQGLVLDDHGLQASAPGSLVLDASFPGPLPKGG